MSTEPALEQEAFRIATASIRRHSMNVEQWKHTLIGMLHPELSTLVSLEANESVMVSAFINAASWYAFTTRRMVSQLHGVRHEVDPRYGITYEVGNFKGIGPKGTSGAVPTEVGKVMSLRAPDPLQFEFETASASMAPVYACIFWSRATRFHHPPLPAGIAGSGGENDG